MAMCEDYPCCGHTDGLGCDWVSPNEVVACDVCIEAKAHYPYHSAVAGCKTQRINARNAVPAGAMCEGCEHENEADLMLETWTVAGIRSVPTCDECNDQMWEYDLEMQRYSDEISNGYNFPRR